MESLDSLVSTLEALSKKVCSTLVLQIFWAKARVQSFGDLKAGSSQSILLGNRSVDSTDQLTSFGRVAHGSGSSETYVN